MTNKPSALRWQRILTDAASLPEEQNKHCVAGLIGDARRGYARELRARRVAYAVCLGLLFAGSFCAGWMWAAS